MSRLEKGNAMSRVEAEDIADHVNGMCMMSAKIAPASRGGFKVITRETGQPPRTFTEYYAAFEVFCASSEEG